MTDNTRKEFIAEMVIVATTALSAFDWRFKEFVGFNNLTDDDSNKLFGEILSHLISLSKKRVSTKE